MLECRINITIDIWRYNMATDLEKYKKALALQQADRLKKRLEGMTYDEITTELNEHQVTYKEHILPLHKPYEEMLLKDNAEELFNGMNEDELKEYEKISNYVLFHALMTFVYNDYRKLKKKKTPFTVVR